MAKDTQRDDKLQAWLTVLRHVLIEEVLRVLRIELDALDHLLLHRHCTGARPCSKIRRGQKSRKTVCGVGEL